MVETLKPLVIIPTYNERENLQHLIAEILAADSRLHILVVDDNSPDNTAGLVRELMANHIEPRLFLEIRPWNMGLGSAYVNGFKWALSRNYNFLIEMDADWSHHPKYLKEMLRLSQQADFVVGSRYVPGGGTVNWGVGRRLLSRFGSFYARIILGVSLADFTGGFGGWHAEVLKKISLDTLLSDGYSFQIELKYRASKLGFRALEFPIQFEERRAGKSKMSLSIVCEAVWRVWWLRSGENII